MSLSTDVITKDHRLEAEASSASENLAKHRWHWTLDQENPSRVPVREYARAVERHPKTIAGQAHGYAAWLVGAGTSASSSLNEHIERARMSEEKAQLVEAVAEANEVGVQQARKVYSSDVSRLREAVERKVERDPDITPEEKVGYTKRLAKTMARSRKVTADRELTKAQRRTAQFMVIDGEVSQALRCIERAVKEARVGGLDPDAVEALTSTLDKLRSMADLLRVAIAGLDIDWDAELVKLGRTG